MQKIKYYALFLPLILLVIMYAGHAVGGLLGKEEFVRLVNVLGFDPEITKLLVFGIFPLDGLVTFLLVFGNKLSARFSWGLLFLWVGLWPWVPRVLEFMGGYEIEWGDAAVASVLAALAYYLYQARDIYFLKKS